MAAINRRIVLQILIITSVICMHDFANPKKPTSKFRKQSKSMMADQSYNEQKITSQENFSCRCQWSRNTRVSFEVPLNDYTVDDNSTQSSNCSLSNFGIDDIEDGEWACHTTTFKLEEPQKPLNNENNPKTHSLAKDKKESVVRRFVTNPQSKSSVRLGKDATIYCELSAHAPWCFWTKDGDVVAIEGRYEYSGDRNVGNCSIRISNVSLVDDGEWICNYPKTSHQGKLKSEKSILEVLVLPTAPIISLNGMALKDGQKIYLTGSINKPATTTQSTEDAWRRRNWLTTPAPAVNKYVITNAVISCWSYNGKPEPKLRWKTNAVFDYSRAVTKSKFPMLLNSKITVPSDAIYPTWHQTNLTCFADELTDYLPHQLKDYSASVEVLVFVNED